MIPDWLGERLAPGVMRQHVGDDVLSALAVDNAGSPYDGRAAADDRLIGSTIYDRLA